MDKKQSAVEWLALYIKGITTLNCDEVIDQAKAMEKEQIIDAYFSAIKSTGEGWNGEYAQGNSPNIEETFQEEFNKWFEQYG
jgi:hypothetical protein